MIGQTVGKYQILDRIGRGSMGTVYRAQDKTLHRDVAIKILNADLSDPAAGRRFRAEAIAIARLNHPGIAKVYDLFEHDGQWLMAMEFVSGETLESLVARIGPLPADQAADLTSQALVALAHAHGMGVVHRDLKPANLMVADGRLKIMDFGIARVAGTEHLTSAGLRMGTPAYMAPEQVLGQEIDARTDIFAMGCVMFFLATGGLPFKGNTAMELVQARLHDDATPVRTMRHELPIWFGQVLERALARDPASRLQTAEEFHLALERGLAGLPLDLPTSPSAMRSDLMETMLPGVMPTAAGTGRGVPSADVAMAPTVMTPAPAAVAAAKPAAIQKQGGKIPLGVIIGALAVVGVIAIFAVQYFRRAGTTPGAPEPQVSPVATTTPAGAETPPAVTPVAATPSSTPAPATTPTVTPAATATSTASPTPTATPGSTPAVGGRGTTTLDPVTFKTARLFNVTGKQAKDQGLTILTLDSTKIVVTQRSPGTPLAIPYKSLAAATYFTGRDPHSADPKTSPNLSAPPKDLDVPRNAILQRPDRNWLVLQSKTTYLILVLADADAEQVLKAIADRTQIKISRPKQ